jgi:hypothetical protein
VAVTWWKAYAKAWRIEVSRDGAQWKEVHRAENKKDFNGDTDAIAFQPVQARHLRLVCAQPGTNWGGYNVYELGVYESMP